MKVTFNKFERAAGLFVGLAILGSVAVTAGVAVKKGWFSSKIEFTTILPSAEGLHPGTMVQVSGIRAGSVSDIELISAEKVIVHFTVLDKFHKQIRQDSRVQVIRPFVIGEKVIDVGVGSQDEDMVEPGGELMAEHTMDVMDLLSGRKLGPFLGSIENVTGNLKVLAQAFSAPERMEAFVTMFDRINPLLNNLNEMSVEITKTTRSLNQKKKLDKIVNNLVSLTTELNAVLPQVTHEVPDMGHQLAEMVKNLNVLTSEFRKLTPAIAAVAPDLPQTSRRAVEALNETVVLLKALQKSFLLRGSVEEVKEAEQERQPASQD